MKLLKSCFYTLTFLLFSIPLCSMEGVEAKLDLFDDHKLHSVKLPFPYISLREDTGKRFTLSEGTLVQYDRATPRDVFIIGPLCPCIGIVVDYNDPKSGHKGIIAHKDFIASTKSLITLCSGLGIEDRSKLKVTLFTNEYPPGEYDRVEVTLNLKCTVRAQYEGRNQKEELCYVADRLANGLGIRSKEITQILWPYQDPRALGRYETAPKYIVVNKQGIIYCSSPFVENIFRFPIPITPWQQNSSLYSQLSFKALTAKNIQLRLAHIKGYPTRREGEFTIINYECAPFIKLLLS